MQTRIFNYTEIIAPKRVKIKGKFMIKTFCDMCGQEKHLSDEPILFTITEHGRGTQQYTLCENCYEKFLNNLTYKSAYKKFNSSWLDTY